MLVVDDEPDTREMLSSALEAHGAEVVTLADAEQALHWLGSSRANLLVSDVAMPRMDGCALIREIRQQGAGPGQRDAGGGGQRLRPAGGPSPGAGSRISGLLD